MIDSRTKLYGVIGNPVRHSLSPLLQNRMLAEFHINARYLAFEVALANVAGVITGMKALGITGLNVTVPHKEKIVHYVDKKSTEVGLLGVANTLKNENGVVSAFVTDPAGFLESLGDRKKMFENAQVLLLGSGGSSRSVAYALGQLGIRQLVIVNRTADRAQRLAHAAVEVFHVPNAIAILYSTQHVNEAISTSHVIINCTSVGMYPHNAESLVTDFSCFHSGHFVYDLIYNPVKTRLLEEAERKGAQIQNGLDMLIFQGLASLRIWENEDFQLGEKLAEMRRSLTEALQ
jgi:shikimate dehydrogenase